METIITINSFLSVIWSNFKYIITVFVFIPSLIWTFQYLSSNRVRDKNGQLLPLPNPFVDISKERRLKQVTRSIFEVVKKSDLWNILGVKIRIAGVQIIFLMHPEYLRIVLSGHHTKFPKSKVYQRLHFFLGESSLVLTEGQTWQRHRHLINPGFHFDAVKGMVGIFSSHALDKVRMLKQKINNLSKENCRIDMNAEVCNMTLSVICESAFGINIQDQQSEHNNNFQRLWRIVEDETTVRLSDPTEWWASLVPWRGKKANVAVKEIDELLKDVIDKRRKQRETNKNQEASKYVPKDLIDILLDAETLSKQEIEGKKELSHKELRDNAATFFFAGFDTTSSLVSWVLYELSLNKNIAVKCKDEIDRVYEDLKLENEIPYEAVQSFEYLASVIKETLRFHTPIPLLGRRTVDEISLPPVKGSPSYHLQKDSFLICLLNVTHRHPDFWEEPNVFNPDRFSKENIKQTIKHPFQYVPFSGGPRNCIGQRFATVEATILLAILIRNFDFDISSDDLKAVRIEETLVQHPRNLVLNVTKR